MRLQVEGWRSGDSLLASSSSLQKTEVVEDDVELVGGLVDHNILDEDQHQLLALGDVRALPKPR